MLIEKEKLNLKTLSRVILLNTMMAPQVKKMEMEILD